MDCYLAAVVGAAGSSKKGLARQRLAKAISRSSPLPILRTSEPSEHEAAASFKLVSGT
jgi:hypothetical protein